MLRFAGEMGARVEPRRLLLRRRHHRLCGDHRRRRRHRRMFVDSSKQKRDRLLSGQSRASPQPRSRLTINCCAFLLRSESQRVHSFDDKLQEQQPYKNCSSSSV